MPGNRFRRIPLWAGLLLLGSPALFSAAAEPAAEFTVTYEHGSLTLQANDAPLDFVVQELAAAASLRLVQYVVLDRRVSVDLESATLPDALAELLAADSYQLFAATDAADGDHDVIPGTLWIFAEGSAAAVAATDYLEIALAEGSLAERREALRELRRLGSPEAIRALSLALTDEHDSIRDLAVEALSAIGGDEALAAIASMAADPNPLARGKAAEAIAIAGGDSARAYLEIALGDANPTVRAAAIDSFAELNDEHTRMLIRNALQDPDPEVRSRAVDVLENLEDEAAFDALMPFE